MDPLLQPLDQKARVLEVFRELLARRQAEGERFKVAAYKKAIAQLEALTTPVTRGEDVSALPGFGKRMQEHVAEILATGTVAELGPATAAATAETHAAIELFMTVPGIGPVRARELVVEHGLRTLDDLRAVQDTVLHEKQRIGLKYVADLQRRIPREEMERHERYIAEVMSRAGVSAGEWALTGSYRRGLATSGDIDVLFKATPATGPDRLRAVVEAMTPRYIRDTLALGEKKYMGVCKLPRGRIHRRLDIMWTTAEQFPFAVLYFTGSGDFNVQMRQWALQRGYSLNEYGLTPTSPATPPAPTLQTERAIFEFLGLAWQEPAARIRDVALAPA